MTQTMTHVDGGGAMVEGNEGDMRPYNMRGYNMDR